MMSIIDWDNVRRTRVRSLPLFNRSGGRTVTGWETGGDGRGDRLCRLIFYTVAAHMETWPVRLIQTPPSSSFCAAQ